MALGRHRCRDMPLSVRLRGTCLDRVLLVPLYLRLRSACLDRVLRDLSQGVVLTITGRCDMRFGRLDGMFAQMAWFCEVEQSSLLGDSNDAYE